MYNEKVVKFFIVLYNEEMLKVGKLEDAKFQLTENPLPFRMVIAPLKIERNIVL